MTAVERISGWALRRRGWIAAASVRIASLWYTAWVNAGSPSLPGSVSVEPTTWGRTKARYRE